MAKKKKVAKKKVAKKKVAKKKVAKKKVAKKKVAKKKVAKKKVAKKKVAKKKVAKRKKPLTPDSSIDEFFETEGAEIDKVTRAIDKELDSGFFAENDHDGFFADEDFEDRASEAEEVEDILKGL